MLRDFGVERGGVVYADSSAALAIAKRKGAGKLRHININCLRIQERQKEKDLVLRLVLGTENPADPMTKHLARQPLDKCMLQLNQDRTSGRAEASLDIRGKGRAIADPVRTPRGGTAVTGRLSACSQPPQCGCTGARLCSLQVCASEPAAARHSTATALRQVSTNADEELDWPTFFQAGGAGT